MMQSTATGIANHILPLGNLIFFMCCVAKRRSSRALLGQLDVKLLERKLSRIESDGTLNQVGGQVQGQAQGQARSGGSSDNEGDADKVRTGYHWPDFH